MNILKSIIVTIVLLFTYISSHAACDDIWDVNCAETIPYCDEYDSSWNNLCWLDEWIKSIDWEIDALVYDRPLSEYVQDVVAFVLTFVTIISVIYIIYAWFVLLTWVWDEEKAKKTKWIITYVIVGLIIMWLAYSIVLFVIDILDQ